MELRLLKLFCVMEELLKTFVFSDNILMSKLAKFPLEFKMICYDKYLGKVLV